MTCDHARSVPATFHRDVLEVLPEDAAAGSFALNVDASYMSIMCPCGCGSNFPLPLNRWSWNGSTEKPSLQPSIRRLSHCKWHGHLQDGVWIPCGDSGR